MPSRGLLEINEQEMPQVHAHLQPNNGNFSRLGEEQPGGRLMHLHG